MIPEDQINHDYSEKSQPIHRYDNIATKLAFSFLPTPNYSFETWKLEDEQQLTFLYSLMQRTPKGVKSNKKRLKEFDR